jgi:hypothetical protein
MVSELLKQIVQNSIENEVGMMVPLPKKNFFLEIILRRVHHEMTDLLRMTIFFQTFIFEIAADLP